MGTKQGRPQLPKAQKRINTSIAFEPDDLTYVTSLVDKRKGDYASRSAVIRTLIAFWRSHHPDQADEVGG